MTTTQPRGTTYRDAGVDIDAKYSAVDRIKEHARATLGADAAPIGHFGGIYRLPAGPDRLLVASADGVGTKLKLAFVLGGDAHARVGADLVNHCVNDVLALGARPIFFLDYVAMGKVDPETVERLVGGMAAACAESGLALIGGETAEMPGLYAEGEYDAAGFIVGTVLPEAVVDGSAVREGDALIGLPSGGLQTNGYSLARRIVGLGQGIEADRQRLADPLPGGGGETVGEALMRPHRSFLPVVLPLVEQGMVRGMGHVTGGGLIDNVPRMLPKGLAVEIDPATWRVPAIFDYLVREGGVPRDEWYRTFNMGIGFVLAVAPADVATVLDRLSGATVIGRVTRRLSDDEPAVRGLSGGDDRDGE